MNYVRAQQVKAQSAKQWRKAERSERMRTMCVWCLALGGVILLLALFMLIGGGGAGNPKTASSIFATFNASGMLRDVAAPTAYVGIGLLIVGLVAGAVAGRVREP
jgi:cytochrome bd-type quinol oxidase subunit 2